ncbi:MAG: biotin synthase BioB [Coriobacteriales bacterium]|nr:biotin synthase BioB [Coriobacteriales bacterium]
MNSAEVYNTDADFRRLLDRLEARIEQESPVTFDEALALTELPDELVPALSALADRVRRRLSGRSVDLCSIVSARTGACGEDCAFCAQSAHYHGVCDIQAMSSAEEIVEAAKRAEASGAHRLGIVTSGGALSDEDFAIAVDSVAKMGASTGLGRCASLGSLTPERVKRLVDAGLDRYHHNLETARSHFGSICSTHSYDDRVAVVRMAQEAGLETCSGGILNLGETPRQRIEFALELRELGPDCVPVNFLDPRPGTPLEHREKISATEAAKYLAIYRLVMPKTRLRLAGGRESTFGASAEVPLTSGVDAMLVGDLLTTAGPSVADDLATIDALDLEARPLDA